jgi:hypothetical protein
MERPSDPWPTFIFVCMGVAAGGELCPVVMGLTRSVRPTLPLLCCVLWWYYNTSCSCCIYYCNQDDWVPTSEGGDRR